MHSVWFWEYSNLTPFTQFHKKLDMMSASPNSKRVSDFIMSFFNAFQLHSNVLLCEHVIEELISNISSLFDAFCYWRFFEHVTLITRMILIFSSVFYHNLAGLHRRGCWSCGDFGFQATGEYIRTTFKPWKPQWQNVKSY